MQLQAVRNTATSSKLYQLHVLVDKEHTSTGTKKT